LQPFRAVDAIQIGGWIAAVACIYAFCRQRKLSASFSFFAVNWILLAAGWAYLLRPWLGPLAFEPVWPDNYIIFGRYLNPGVISYFFQTPYCAGLSVFFLTLALVFRAADSDSPPDLAAAIFALGALSIFQVSLFFSSCLSLGFLWLYRR